MPRVAYERRDVAVISSITSHDTIVYLFFDDCYCSINSKAILDKADSNID